VGPEGQHAQLGSTSWEANVISQTEQGGSAWEVAKVPLRVAKEDL
jgi:hypothetical protein